MKPVQFKAWLDSLDGRPPKPKKVAEDGEIVRDADPHVSKVDPNYVEGGVVEVRRDDLDEIRRHNAGLIRRRGWKVEVDKLSAAVPADVDRSLEQRRELAIRERKERLRQNPTGWGVGETMAEIVSRQNGGDDAA
jgi:hypothetical protein